MLGILKKTALATVAVAAVAVAGPAAAITVGITENVTIEAAGFHEYQQTVNSPCVIGENSCSNPAGMSLTVLASGGGSTYLDIFSPNYSASLLRGILGGDSFHVGLDVNQTNVNQILDVFVMLVNGVQTYAFDTVTTVAAGANGNGYADFVLKGFSLAGLADTDVVSFGMDMSLRNDGREQFFLIPVAQVPVPAAGFLLLGALGGLAALRRRKTA